MTATLTGNERRPEWHAYCRDRAQRRQDHVAALAREAEQAAPDPIRKVLDGGKAARRAEAEFDAREPELGYDEWKAKT